MIRKPITNYVFAQQVATTGVTGQTGPITLRYADFDSMVFALTCSGISGTSTLDVWVQTSPDCGTTFFDTARFARVSATGASPTFVAASLFANSAPGVVNANASSISTTAGGNALPLLSNVFNILWGLGGTTPSASFGVTGICSSFDRGGI
jgi:hypothetical protein